MTIFLQLSILIIGAYGYVIYIQETIQGKVKPNKASWFIWGLAPSISFFLSIREGGAETLNLLPVAIAAFAPFCIILFSFLNKESYWKLGLVDYVCFALSLISIGLWLFIHALVPSLIFAILTDICAGIPVLLKVYKYPETESVVVWVASLVTLVLGLLLLKDFSFINAGFTYYLLIINIILITIFYKSKIKEKFFRK